MATPFDQAYDSREEMLTALRNYAISQGYAISTIRSNPDRNICIGCDRGGQYTDRINAAEGAKRRKTSTRRIRCSFRLYASKSSAKHSDGKWYIKVSNPDHNHELEDNMIAHPAARTITQEQQATIYHYLDENIPPRQIISLIKKSDPTILITPMDVYNLRKSFLRQQLAGRTPIQYLQDQLYTHQWKFAFKQDKEGCITFFMFASPQSIRYANQYNRVFVLDYIYKTNRYGMPLLHIIGVSPSNTTFSIALCFMENEQEESYEWALKTFFSWLNPLVS
jgi:alpha-glucosidase